MTTATEVAWRIDWRGRSWSSTDLTGRHAAIIAELLDVPPSWSWFDLDELHPAYGPLQVMALVAAFVIVDDQVTGAAARRAVLDTIQGATVVELLDAVQRP